ncbi:MAG: SprB repeat-containing protein, partial [Bacteroidota bacterium]
MTAVHRFFTRGRAPLFVLLMVLGMVQGVMAQCPGAPLNVTISNTDVDACTGYNPASITTTVTGGSGTYTFQWYLNGSPITDSTRDALNLTPFGTIGSFTYSVVVTDNCMPANADTSNAKLFNIVADPTVSISGSLSGCQGSSFLLTANPAGGTGSNIYYWQSSPTGMAGSYTDITGETNSTFPPPTTTPGTYYYQIRVTGGAACPQRTASAVVTVNANPTATSTYTDVLCFNGTTGSMTAVVAGGTPPYSYVIVGPVVNTTGASTGVFTGLSIGSYTITVTDANNCTTSTSQTISQPTAITATTVITNVLCNAASTGSVVITPAGGVGPYTITPAQTGLPAGSYTFTVTDANNCTLSVPVTITQPTTITVTTAITNVLCNGA